MPIEIERKFLLKNDSWRNQVIKTSSIIQGYLANTDHCSIRIRLADDQASLNIKSMTIGVTRSEFDYPVPMDEAKLLLKDLCPGPVIEKIRHYVDYAGHTWEIDEFLGENSGLVVAEIELQHQHEEFSIPDWLGKEVSDDQRYYNICLADNPYTSWLK